MTWLGTLFGKSERRGRKAKRAAPRPPRRRSMQLQPGLSRQAAYRQASKRTTGADFRGFTYNRRTGRASLV